MSPKNQPLESSIVRAILNALNALPGCVAIKQHGSQYSRAGEPDITGCINGQRFDIEVKRPGRGPTKIQQKRLRQWEKAGSLTGVAYNVDDAKRIIYEGLRRKERTKGG